MPLAIGVVLNNRYRIVGLLGQGGFGAVYRAFDQNMSKPVAIKENLDTSPDAQRQFWQEAQILSNLRHPNLPLVTDHFVIQGLGQYLVMDFVDGEDLQDKLDKAGRALSEAQVLSWIVQVCDALTYLHSQTPPIIHRDIKPANIKITLSGKAVLVDFGISKVFDPAIKTTTGARAYSPPYAPPEQYGQGRTDARSDIYALGATLYTVLTGQEPPESVQRQAGVKMIPPRQLVSGITPKVESAILRSSELDMTRRFQSVTELRRKLTTTAQHIRIPTSTLLIVVLMFLLGTVLILNSVTRVTWNPTTIPTATIAFVATPIPGATLPIAAIGTATSTETTRLTSTPIATPTETPETPTVPIPPTQVTPPPPTLISAPPTVGLIMTPVTVFSDNFNGSSLDSSRWVIDNESNPFAINNGTLQMASSSNTYPYVHTRYNPFPSSGNFRLKYRLRYPWLSTCGVGVMMTSYTVLAGLSQSDVANFQQANEQNGVAAGIWQDEQSMQIWFRSGTDRVDVPISQLDTSWHKVAIEYSDAHYKIHLDNRLIYTSLETPYRPQFIWMGHPANLGSNCSWSSLEIDYVTVESLA